MLYSLPALWKRSSGGVEWDFSIACSQPATRLPLSLLHRCIMQPLSGAAIGAKRSVGRAEKVSARLALRAVSGQTMMPKGVRVGLLTAGNLKISLAGSLCSCVNRLAQSHTCFDASSLDVVDIHFEERLNFRPLLAGEHGYRQLASPAVVGLWHGSAPDFPTRTPAPYGRWCRFSSARSHRWGIRRNGRCGRGRRILIRRNRGGAGGFPCGGG